MVDHQDRMDPWMETPPGVGGSWDRRGILVCPPSLSPVRGLMIPMPTANLWHSGWLIINKPCWWKFCKFSETVWQTLWNSIHERQFLMFIRIFMFVMKFVNDFAKCFVVMKTLNSLLLFEKYQSSLTKQY